LLATCACPPRYRYIVLLTQHRHGRRRLAAVGGGNGEAPGRAGESE
jgi:hypothetical protein